MSASDKAAPGEGPQSGTGHPWRMLQPSLPKIRSRIHSKTPTDIPMGMGAGPTPPGQRFMVKTQHLGNFRSSPGSERSQTPAASPSPLNTGALTGTHLRRCPQVEEAVEGGAGPQLPEEEAVPVLVNGPLQRLQVPGLKEVLGKDVPGKGQKEGTGQPASPASGPPSHPHAQAASRPFFSFHPFCTHGEPRVFH